MIRALSPIFNDVVARVIATLLPNGFDTTPDDGTLDTLAGHYNATGRIMVWDGASDRTVFASPRINHCFRAWHDATHLATRNGFDAEGEHRTAIAQCGHVAQLGLSARDRRIVQRLIMCEVDGQVSYYENTGEFVEDQHGFARHCLETYSTR